MQTLEKTHKPMTGEEAIPPAGVTLHLLEDPERESCKKCTSDGTDCFTVVEVADGYVVFEADRIGRVYGVKLEDWKREWEYSFEVK